jgi:hypothetical protein
LINLTPNIVMLEKFRDPQLAGYITTRSVTDALDVCRTALDTSTRKPEEMDECN